MKGATASIMHYACLSLLTSCSISILADQPELLEQLNDPRKYRTGYYKHPENDPKNQNQQPRKRFIDKQDELPEVPEEVVEDIMREYPEIAARVALLQNEEAKDNFVPKNLLLVGQPGCGKTTMAVATAIVLKRRVAYFEAPSLVGDEYQNSGVNFIEAKLEKIHQEIQRNPHEKYVVIIDEIMRLAEKYKNEKGEGKDIATKLWLVMDRYKRSDRVFFIATANDVDDLPEQIKSRFSQSNIVEVRPPSKEYRRKVIFNCLRDQHNLSDKELDNLVNYTEGLTHRQIETIIEDGAMLSAMKSGDISVISYEQLKEAIGKEKNVGFIGRWIYDPINNWFVDPVNDLIFKPANAFWDRHEKGIDRGFKLLTGGAAFVGLAAGLIVISGATGGAATAAAVCGPAVKTYLLTKTGGLVLVAGSSLMLENLNSENNEDQQEDENEK